MTVIEFAASIANTKNSVISMLSFLDQKLQPVRNGIIKAFNKFKSINKFYMNLKFKSYYISNYVSMNFSDFIHYKLP